MVVEWHWKDALKFGIGKRKLKYKGHPCAGWFLTFSCLTVRGYR